MLFLVMKIGASFLSAYAPNYPTIVVARAIQAMGSTGTYAMSFCLSKLCLVIHKIHTMAKPTLHHMKDQPD